MMTRGDEEATNRIGDVAGGPARHIPVLLDAVVEALAPVDGGRYIDGTFGRGGYTAALLEAADCRVLAIDRDPDAVAAAEALKARFGNRLTGVEGRFGALDAIAEARGFAPVDGIALDVGVSSAQLDDPARGFSFQTDGPLDMRMAKSGPSAADVVNGAGEGLLADILFHFGEERAARRIARRIVETRRDAPIDRTLVLADLVSGIVRTKPGARHPATRTFQALRIFVNGELDQLADALAAAERVLKPDGRLAVVAFHSLEDRLVKTFLTDRADSDRAGSRHMPAVQGQAPTFRRLFNGARKPSSEETSRNPRARSARLRAAIRTDAPARSLDRSRLLPPVPSIMDAGV